MLAEADIPISSIVTAVTALISVYVGNRLSSWSSGKAKIWDLRRPAYGRILAALSTVEKLCDSAAESMAENIHRYHDGGHREYIEGKISESMTVARNTFNDEYLILSNDFVAAFEKLTGDLDAIDPNEVFPEDHELFAAAIRKHRPPLLALARREVAGGRFSGLRPRRRRT